MKNLFKPFWFFVCILTVCSSEKNNALQNQISNLTDTSDTNFNINPEDTIGSGGLGVKPTRNRSSISQYGVTWYFDKEYLSGSFANGDFWVTGDPVIITRITPDFDSISEGFINGWEINPVVEGGQGFATVTQDFDRSLVPSLPCTLTEASSIVKSIRSSGSGRRGSLKTAVVLTVLTEIPPNNGNDLFRPPYVGVSKPFYQIADLKTDLLPSLSYVSNMVSLTWVETTFVRLQLDHKEAQIGRQIHPVENVPDYGAEIGTRNADGALRLMLEDPVENKIPAHIAYVQYGIDLYHMMLIGHTWPAGGGHRPGQKLPLTFAAVLLGNEEMKTAMKNETFLHENEGVLVGSEANIPLYGFTKGYEGDYLESKYWEVVISHTASGNASGYKSFLDPYGYIDGGPEPGTYYQLCCTTQPWKGSVLCVHLMPALKEIWNDTILFSYIDRWVERGIHAQPDPCAPAEGTMDNYGITFGPDPNSPGDCIKDTDASDGIGRYPSKHGMEVNGGSYGSAFVNAMWNKYRHQ